MNHPTEALRGLKQQMKKEWKAAFGSAFLIGLFVHMPILLSDIPNHDGLASMYFDQNMITSGRWFLTVACGFSSYYTIPWVIGLLGLLFLSCTAVCLTELLELKDTIPIVLISGLLVTFPALTSTFAYVFTLDGYMLAMFLAVLSVLLTKKYRWGFLAGAVCLAFSMGTYQAYLPFAVLLCIYLIVIRFMQDGRIQDKLKEVLKYLLMGGLGMALYFILLYLLLNIQNKELASYQGINNLEGGTVTGLSGGDGMLHRLMEMYRDFFAFTLKGGVIANNLFSKSAYALLLLLFLCALGKACIQKKWWEKILFWIVVPLLVLGLPLATNMIQLISPDLNYHLLMRYQWVLYPILMIAFLEYCGRGDKTNGRIRAEWGTLLAVGVLIFNYAVTDNIAYSNLQKRYEKTYAYCLRLLDRMEQTPGYYRGIPIAMIGVVGDEEYPLTDITDPVTAGMIGIHGDSLLYTGANYESFMKNYLGATLNFLEPEAMGEIYYSEEYRAMESFPGATATKVVDGVLYVKTENVDHSID